MNFDDSAYIYRRIEAIVALRELRRTVDPASGMAVSVRRGPAHVDDDKGLPWCTTDYIGAYLGGPEEGGCAGMHQLIDMLIAEQTRSLKFWIESAQASQTRIATAIEAGLSFLASDGETKKNSKRR